MHSLICAATAPILNQESLLFFLNTKISRRHAFCKVQGGRRQRACAGYRSREMPLRAQRIAKRNNLSMPRNV